MRGGNARRRMHDHALCCLSFVMSRPLAAKLDQCTRLDACEDSAYFGFHHLAVIVGLQVQPDFGGPLEMPGEAKGSISDDGALALDDLIDAARWKRLCLWLCGICNSASSVVENAGLPQRARRNTEGGAGYRCSLGRCRWEGGGGLAGLGTPGVESAVLTPRNHLVACVSGAEAAQEVFGARQ